MRTLEGVYVPGPVRPSRTGLAVASAIAGAAATAAGFGFFLAPVVLRALFGG